MAWTDRLRPEIIFNSPSGLAFKPLWKGDDISATKRLGRHAYPNLDKELVQDLGMNSREIPLTVYFDGPDNDKIARSFEAALFEPGPWNVIHPIYGLLQLQLVAYKISLEPVANGNVTVLKTEWIEPATEDDIASIPDPAVAVDAAVVAVNAAAIAETTTIPQETVSQSKAAGDAIKQGTAAIIGSTVLQDANIAAIEREIHNLANEPTLDLFAIASRVISLIQTPDRLVGSINAKIAAYANFGRRIINALPREGTSFSNAITASLIGQLFLNIITAGMGKTITSELMETRREALSALNAYLCFTTETQAALDFAVAATANNRIEQQFVARAHSGEMIATLNAAVVRYLLGAMFDLKIERRITLDRPRSPKEIALTEYRASKENADYYVDLFCKTNHLHGKDLLLLPASREVVIYA